MLANMLQKAFITFLVEEWHQVHEILGPLAQTTWLKLPSQRMAKVSFRGHIVRHRQTLRVLDHVFESEVLQSE